jgi:hypothetical protein
VTWHLVPKMGADQQKSPRPMRKPGSRVQGPMWLGLDFHTLNEYVLKWLSGPSAKSKANHV